MKYKGKKIELLIQGESHSPNISMQLRGLPFMQIDVSVLQQFMARRRGGQGYTAPRVEADVPELSYNAGCYYAKLKNENHHSADYSALYAKPRPSHADYALWLKDGSLSNVGGGRFSGRMTAPLCIAGFICKQYLLSHGVSICSAVTQIGNCRCQKLNASFDDYQGILSGFPSFGKSEEFIDILRTIGEKGDSVGGSAQCTVFGFPAGKGDAFTEGLESLISPLLFAIPAVKGVEFGLGFGFAEAIGSEANDPLQIENGVIHTLTNNSGGINGGISNGEPLVMGVAFRPTPSIAKAQQTVDLQAMQNTKIQICGRHDACVVPRALPAVESAVALALANIIAEDDCGN